MTEPSYSRAARPPIDIWVRRALKQRYDAALDETMPVELLDLLDQADASRP